MPDAHDDEVALDPAARRRHHPLDPRRSLERSRRPRRRCELDAVIAVDPFDHAPDLASEHAFERDGQRLDRDHVQTEAAQRGCDLGADEAHARRRRPGPCPGPLPGSPRSPQRSAGRGSRRVPPPEQPAVSAGPRLRSSSASYAEPGPVSEQHVASGRVDPVGRLTEPKLDVELVPDLLRTHDERVELAVAAQKLLGQRRPLVRQFRLLSDEDEPPVVALVAQRHGRRAPGEARADDDDRLRARHQYP